MINEILVLLIMDNLPVLQRGHLRYLFLASGCILKNRKDDIPLRFKAFYYGIAIGVAAVPGTGSSKNE
jgi:hypothetical protein